MRQISKHNILFQKILQLQQAIPVRHEIKIFLRVRRDLNFFESEKKFENHWVKVINIFFTFPNKFNVVAYICPPVTRKRYDELT